MGTHPIFESDFDCLTERKQSRNMESLIEMGFPSNACKRAMYYSDGNIEAAMNWLCAHMDDPDYNTAFEPPTTQTSSVPTRPTGEQLASLPDDYKVFTNEIINDIAYP